MIAAEQNYFIATCMERAQRTIATLMEHDVEIARIDLGTYSDPVIHVRHSEALEKLKGHGYCRNPDGKRRVWVHRAALNQCLVIWEEPMIPAITTTGLVAVH